MNSTVKNLQWSLLGVVAKRSVSLLLFLFIARFATKTDVGIFREFSLILSIPLLLSWLSYDYYYITQKRRVAFFALMQSSTLFSFAFWILLLASSTVIGSFYKSGTLAEIIALLSILSVLEIFRRNLQVFHQKKMQFRKLALGDLYNTLVYTGLIIAIIPFWSSAWLLCFAFYLGDVFEVIYLAKDNSRFWLKVFWRSLRFRYFALTIKNFKRAKEFLTFQTLTHFSGFLAENSPVLYLGGYFSAAESGIYYLAAQLVNLPFSMLSTALTNVFFPALSRLDKPAIKERFLRYSKFCLLVGWGFIFVYLVFLQKLTLFIVGERWVNAIAILPALSLVAASNLLVNPVSSVIMIFNRSRWEFFWSLFAFAMRVGALALFAPYGFVAAVNAFCWAGFISHLCLYLLIFIFCRGKKQDFFNLLPSFFSASLFLPLFLALCKMPTLWALPLSIIVYLLFLWLSNIFTKGFVRKNLLFFFQREK